MDGAYLEVWRDGSGEIVRLEGDRCTLGRSPANGVAFPADQTVSSEHAQLARTAEGWFVRDAGSANGTYVNGERVGEWRLLRPGDEIALGRSRTVFRVGAAPVAPPPGGPVPATGYLDATEEWNAGRAAGAGASPGAQPTPAPASAPVAPHRAPAAPARVPAASGRRQGRASVRGTARGIQSRKEGDMDVLAFRVDRYDSSGNRLDPVGVELRGHSRGQVSEGDEVDVTGRWSRGTVRAKTIVNLSTGAEVRGLGTVAYVALYFVFGAIVLFILFVIFMIVTGGGGP